MRVEKIKEREEKRVRKLLIFFARRERGGSETNRGFHSRNAAETAQQNKDQETSDQKRDESRGVDLDDTALGNSAVGGSAKVVRHNARSRGRGAAVRNSQDGARFEVRGFNEVLKEKTEEEKRISNENGNEGQKSKSRTVVMGVAESAVTMAR
jgi:hypothetical protein